MLKEFKEFAMKGSVVDLAVGVIIGGAFGKIVTSLVNDIIMPFFGIILGQIDFTSLKYVIRPGVNGSQELALRYGMFIQNIVDFLIISFSIFMIIKLLNSVRKKKEKEEVIAETPKQEALLAEIRDLLKESLERE